MKTINPEKKLSMIVIVAIVLLGVGFAQANVLTGTGKAIKKLVLKTESRELSSLASHSHDAAARLLQAFGEDGAENFLRNLAPAAKDLMARNAERGADFFIHTGPAAESLALKYGDDILRVFEAAGGNTLEWVSRYGDEGVRAAGRFGVAATEELAQKAGVESLEIANRMGHPAMAILKRNPEAVPLFRQAIEEGSEQVLLDTIERGGDRFFQFVQRNWKGIAVASLCAAFFTQPDKFIEPAKEAWNDTTHKAADLLKEVIVSAFRIPVEIISDPQSFGGAILTFCIIFGIAGFWMILRHFRLKAMMMAEAKQSKKLKIDKTPRFKNLKKAFTRSKDDNDT